MPATNISVRIDRISVISCDDHSDWSFRASVRKDPSGGSETILDTPPFEAKKDLVLNPMPLGQGVKIETGDEKVEITLKGTQKGFTHTNLGEIKVVLNVPIYNQYSLSLSSSENFFAATISVKIIDGGGVTAPGGILSTITDVPGGDIYNTVNDGMQVRNVQICPVIPLPANAVMPPLSPGVMNLKISPPFAPFSDPVDASVIPKQPLNFLWNPALIPAIPTSDPEFDKRCAKIRITKYWPDNMDTAKLIWKAKTANVLLIRSNTVGSTTVGSTTWGSTIVDNTLEVMAYGVLTGEEDEECEIEVRWDEPGQPLLAVYRAIVGKPKYIWTRANIVNYKTPPPPPPPAPAPTPTVMNPTITPDKIEKNIEHANILLWQSGILLTMDNDRKIYHTAAKCLEGLTPGKSYKGIFTIETAENHTFNIDGDDNPMAPVFNLRKGVLNLAFIHSVHTKEGRNLGGLATDFLKLKEGYVTDAGSPSTSWVHPTGVYPDDPGGTVKMALALPLAAAIRRFIPFMDNRGGGEEGAQPGALDTMCAAIITEARRQDTVAHEVGHVLCLRHRGKSGDQVLGPEGQHGSADGVNHLSGPYAGYGHPRVMNVMSASGLCGEAQDFDLIQTKAMRMNGLLRSSPP